MYPNEHRQLLVPVYVVRLEDAREGAKKTINRPDHEHLFGPRKRSLHVEAVFGLLAGSGRVILQTGFRLLGSVVGAGAF